MDSRRAFKRRPATAGAQIGAGIDAALQHDNDIQRRPRVNWGPLRANGAIGLCGASE